jgi:hypothetical protein
LRAAAWAVGAAAWGDERTKQEDIMRKMIAESNGVYLED